MKHIILLVIQRVIELLILFKSLHNNNNLDAVMWQILISFLTIKKKLLCSDTST